MQFLDILHTLILWLHTKITRNFVKNTGYPLVKPAHRNHAVLKNYIKFQLGLKVVDYITFYI